MHLISEVQQLFYSSVPQPSITAQLQGLKPNQLMQVTVENPPDEPLNPLAQVNLGVTPIVGVRTALGPYNLTTVHPGQINITLPQTWNLTSQGAQGYNITSQAKHITCSAFTSGTSQVRKTLCDTEPQPCLNAGNCSYFAPSIFSFNCSCVCGWSGYRCDVPTTAASRNCSCSAGTTGAFCNQTDLCSLGVCANQGVCTMVLPSPSVTDYSCNCSTSDLGWSGRNCTQFSACAVWQPCLQGSTCLTTPSGDDYFCRCNETRIGRNCTLAAPTSQCNNATSLLLVYSLDFSAPLTLGPGVNYAPLAGLPGSTRLGLASFPSPASRIDLLAVTSSPMPSPAARALAGSTPQEAVGVFPVSQLKNGFALVMWTLMQTNQPGQNLYDFVTPSNTDILVLNLNSAAKYSVQYSRSANGDELSTVSTSSLVTTNPMPTGRWLMHSFTLESVALGGSKILSATQSTLWENDRIVAFLPPQAGLMLTALLSQAWVGNSAALSPTSPFPGCIQSLAVFSRSLRQQEIEQLFYSSVPRPLMTCRLVGLSPQQLMQVTLAQPFDEPMNLASLVYLQSSVVSVQCVDIRFDATRRPNRDSESESED